MSRKKIKYKKLTGRELIKIRNKLGLDTYEMAKVMGTPYETYMDWERERRGITPAVTRLVKIIVDISGTDVGEKYGV